MSHTLRKSIFQRVFVGVSRELIWQVNTGGKWIAKGNGDERKLCMVHCHICNIYGTSRWWGATLKSSYGKEQATKERRFFMGGVDPSRCHEQNFNHVNLINSTIMVCYQLFTLGCNNFYLDISPTPWIW